MSSQRPCVPAALRTSPSFVARATRIGALVLLLAGCGGEEATPAAPGDECNHYDCANEHPPEIQSIEPMVCQDDACFAPLTTPIWVRFTEPIDPMVAAGGRADCMGYINAWAISAGAATGQCIEGTVTVNDATLLLTPTLPLLPATQYQVHVSEAVRDLSGATMQRPFDWNFTTQSAPVCGNGELSPDEVCDDGNVLPGDYCAPDCSLVTGECGDGALQAGLEACDDANEQPLDGCSPRCTVEIVPPKLLPASGASCGLRRDGSLLCWGGPLDGAPEGVFADLAVSDNAACAMTAPTAGGGRDLVCWGASSLWMTVDFTSIVAAGNHLCGLRTDGSAGCLALDGVSTPLSLPAGAYAQLVVERDFACGIRADGSVGCAGSVPPQIASATGIAGIAAGNGFACVLHAAGAIECHGLAGSGILPVEAPPGPFQAIDAGPDFVCGQLTRGDLACWRLMGGAAAAPEGAFTAFGVGAEHSCGINAMGAGQCWAAEASDATRVPDDFN
jgi:cysteine-rich repeat protein